VVLWAASGARDTKVDDGEEVDVGVVPKAEAYSMDDDVTSRRLTAPACIRIFVLFYMRNFGWGVDNEDCWW